MSPSPPLLNDDDLRLACDVLGGRDPDLAGVIERLGPPPMWGREPGFPTLVHIILEQQVSLASAKATFGKLNEAVSPLEPVAFLTLDDAMLRTIGFSGQKGRYCRELARALLDRRLDLERLPTLADDRVRRELTAITGIGRWTADIYLLTALARPDVWPRGDLALHRAVRDLKGLGALPSRDEFELMGEPWRPLRSVAARILWNHYLHPPTLAL